MRLHHLKIEAFGPFGGIAEVDFDALNDAGQFLISGATGSGKTFILDAVCFALYGEVPGERQRARHLRSDHAAPGAEPRVTLTLTVAERILRISRTPAWNRPKRRGEGTTLQQASVRLEQQVDGVWSVLATRLDEAGHLINLWLGMTPTQFTQVALLPQGGFQTFLHSPTAVRQVILQRLFRTDRYERVEKWFGDFRRTLNRSRHDSLHAIDVIAHRLGEAARGTEPPAEDAGVDAIAAWSAEQCSAVEALHEAATAAHGEAIAAHAVAREELDAGAALSAILDRAAQAQQHLVDLEQSAPAFANDVALLRAHERAQQLMPLIRAHASARASRDAVTHQASIALERAGVGLADHDQLEELVEQARGETQRAERAGALSTKLNVLHVDARVAEDRWQTAVTDLAELRTAAQTLPADLERITQRLREASEAEIHYASGRAELEAAQLRLAAAIDLEKARAELNVKSALRTSEQRRVQDLREIYQNAREARIEAMASELASALVVGCSCPVCGSTSHPTPATGVSGVGRKNEERARRAYESAHVELNALDEVIAGLRARAEALARTSLGGSVDTLTEHVAALQERQSAVSILVDALDDLRSRETEIKSRLGAAQVDIERSVQHEAQAHAQVDLFATQIRDVDTELQTALGEYPDAVTFASQTREQSARLVSARAAVRSLQEATSLACQQLAALDRQATEFGFESGHQAEAAIMAPEAAAEVEEQEREREHILHTATATLVDPEVLASLRLPRPDLSALRLIAAQQETALAGAQADLRIIEGRAERTQAIARELAAAIDAYRPLEVRANQVAELSALLEGTSTDNRLRMRLSAFVLAERLRQVIAAANARLETISEGRYVLSYQEERGAGDARGGLSISVLDEWTGVRRDPTTLSGGETFVVSLCLALGLADTVADESGGLRIDTLFIDEGFGSLDAQTLDSVIDILGQLSQGGRVTAVVSHVQELRERLPAVLEVVPSKSGSTIRNGSA